ncbi:hypothetical protein TNCV_2937401 [Trichonephila clavipes]|nr:hypothetical protein TNCV_2937401 [Trichonephila clavipes]
MTDAISDYLVDASSQRVPRQLVFPNEHYTSIHASLGIKLVRTTTECFFYAFISFRILRVLPMKRLLVLSFLSSVACRGLGVGCVASRGKV